MKRNIVVLLIIFILGGVAIFQSFSNANPGNSSQNNNFDLLSGDEILNEDSGAVSGEHALKIGFLAPKFSLEGLDGDVYTVDGARDRAVLLNFWASWCGPCHAEAPDLIELHEKYSDRLDIYAINVTKMDTIENAIGFVEEYQFQFPILMDLDNDVTSTYRVRGYPTNILIDTNGVIQEYWQRMLLPNDIKSIENFLK